MRLIHTWSPLFTLLAAGFVFAQDSTPPPADLDLFPHGVVSLPQSVLNARNRPGYTIGSFTQMLDANPSIRSIEDAIPHLPSQYRDHASFIFQSQSLQGATTEYPRAVVYGDYEHNFQDFLTITFKGKSDLPAVAGITNDDLEFMDFNSDTEAFEFYALHFEPNGKSNYKVIGPNPPVCMGCHAGTQKNPDPRPNWSRYPEWPGVYGSSDFHQTQTEKDGWKTFYVNQLKTGRYKSLNLNPVDYLATTDKDYLPSTLTNLRFDAKLDVLNGKRVARLIQATPDYAKYRFAIYAGLRNCPDLPSFLPATYPKLNGMTFDEILADTEQKQKDCCTSKRSIIKPYQATRIANLRYLFESRGIAIDGWFTNFGVNDYHQSVQVRQDSEEPLIQAFQANLEQDPALKRFIPTVPENYDFTQDSKYVNCSGLKQASLR